MFAGLSTGNIFSGTIAMFWVRKRMLSKMKTVQRYPVTKPCLKTPEKLRHTDNIDGGRHLDEMLSLDQATLNRMSKELSTSSLEQF